MKEGILSKLQSVRAASRRLCTIPDNIIGGILNDLAETIPERSEEILEAIADDRRSAAGSPVCRRLDS